MSREQLEQVVDACYGVQAEYEAMQVVVQSNKTHTTRFADSTIFQNSSQHEIEATVKVIVNGKVGQAVSNQLNASAVESLVRQAVTSAGHATAHKHEELPQPLSVGESEHLCLAEPSPAQCSQLAASVVDGCVNKGVSASGLVSSLSGEILVASTSGVTAYAPVYLVDANLVASKEDSSGYANAVVRDIRNIEPASMVDRAVQKCLAGLNRQRAEPGAYEVILEEPAVASLLLWLSYMGFGVFGPHAAERGDSVLYNNLGQRLFGDNITIYDDGNSPDTLTLPVDYEGMPRQRVTLVDRGIANAIVHDSATAKRFNTTTTGHCNIDEGVGPTPLHVFMVGGNSSVDEMVKSTTNGILVTRFHGALTPLDSNRLQLAGVTRDGTFRIKDGQIIGGIKNMRWTDSLLDVFSNVVALSRPTRLNIPAQVSTTSCYNVPAVKVAGFKFTDVQEF